MFKKIISAVIVIIMFISCKSSVLDANQFAKLAAEGESVEFETITLEKGTSGNTDIEDQNLVIRNYDAFERLWNELYEGREPMPEMPVIDFNSKMVIAALGGTKQHGGYSIEITELALSGDELGVKVKSTEPADDCVTTMALNSPFHLVKVKKMQASVSFYEVTEEQQCSN